MAEPNQDNHGRRRPGQSGAGAAPQNKSLGPREPSARRQSLRAAGLPVWGRRPPRLSLRPAHDDASDQVGTNRSADLHPQIPQPAAWVLGEPLWSLCCLSPRPTATPRPPALSEGDRLRSAPVCTDPEPSDRGLALAPALRPSPGQLSDSLALGWEREGCDCRDFLSGCHPPSWPRRSRSVGKGATNRHSRTMNSEPPTDHRAATSSGSPAPSCRQSPTPGPSRGTYG